MQEQVQIARKNPETSHKIQVMYDLILYARTSPVSIVLAEKITFFRSS